MENPTVSLSAPLLSASLWRRLAAMVYDSFLLAAIALFYTAIHLFIKAQLFGVEHIRAARAGTAGDIFLFIGVLLSISCFYYWFWTRKGQTLGMLAWRLRVEQENGKNITGKQTLIRLAVATGSLLCAGLGYFWCLFGKKQCWQDIASGTRIVLLPKKP
jgi:uncharacterized RDD family membrane protein YckC